MLSRLSRAVSPSYSRVTALSMSAVIWSREMAEVITSAEKPEEACPHFGICGGCIYCHDTDMDSIRREIAECFECEPGDIHLYSYHEKTVCYFESEQDEEEFGMEM